jgi:hypothetical protein
MLHASLPRFSLGFLRFGTHSWLGLATDVEPIHFPGSRIILNNATWGAAVNTWANKSAAQVWSRCYSSLTDNHDNATAFHAQCDQHNITVVFARNSIGNVFGGYVRGLSHIFCPFSLSFPVDFLVN